MADYAEGRVPRFIDTIAPGDRLVVDVREEFQKVGEKFVTVTDVRSTPVESFMGVPSTTVTVIGQDDDGLGWSGSYGSQYVATLLLPNLTREVK